MEEFDFYAVIHDEDGAIYIFKTVEDCYDFLRPRIEEDYSIIGYHYGDEV